MTDKIICWVDTSFTHFGIAKSMQEKNDLKLYSIIDVDEKAKEFFLDQKILAYKLIYFLLVVLYCNKSTQF